MSALLVGFYLAGVAALAHGDEADSTARTRGIVITLIEAFNAHDLDALLAHYHPDVVKINPHFPEPRSGKAVVRDGYAGLFRRFPDVQDTIQRLVVDGDQAAVELSASWSVPGRPHERRTMRIAAFLRIREGRIVEDVTYYDPRALTPE